MMSTTTIATKKHDGGGSNNKSKNKNNDDSNNSINHKKAARIRNLLNTRDRHLSTAEHWSAGGGHISCLKYLFQLRQKYDDVGHCDKNSSSSGNGGNHHRKEDNSKRTKIRRRDGKTCLHYAARNGHIDCIRYLLRDHARDHDNNDHQQQQKEKSQKGNGQRSHFYHVDVDERSGDGTTPLHLACFGGHFEAIKELILTHGANPNITNDWDCNVAHWVAMNRTGATTTTANTTAFTNASPAVTTTTVTSKAEPATPTATNTITSAITTTATTTTDNNNNNNNNNDNNNNNNDPNHNHTNVASSTTTSINNNANSNNTTKHMHRKDNIQQICNFLQSLGVNFLHKQKQGHTPLHKAAQCKNKYMMDWLASSKSKSNVLKHKTPEQQEQQLLQQPLHKQEQDEQQNKKQQQQERQPVQQQDDNDDGNRSSLDKNDNSRSFSGDGSMCSGNMDGAGLTKEQLQILGQPDNGGHKPSAIWRSVGGSENVAQWMEREMGW